MHCGCLLQVLSMRFMIPFGEQTFLILLLSDVSNFFLWLDLSVLFKKSTAIPRSERYSPIFPFKIIMFRVKHFSVYSIWN